jgi:hypothetical protein
MLELRKGTGGGNGGRGLIGEHPEPTKLLIIDRLPMEHG